jgi:membrane-bound lytic murein transglycosylase D
LLLPGCGNQRKVQVHQPVAVAPPPPAPIADIPEAKQPSEAERQTLLRREMLVKRLQEAGQLFEQGRQLFEAGKVEPGRSYLRQALDHLKEDSEGSSPAELEAGYFAFLSQVQELELEFLTGSPEASFDDEPSAIDQLAHINLFTIKVDPALRELAHEDLLDSRFDIPVVLNESVLKFLRYYRTRGHRVMTEGLKRSGKYLGLFRKIFREEGVPLDLIYVAHVESLYKPRALSRARAKGIWQFVRGTGSVYGLKQTWWIDERSDILKSTSAAARHLRDLYDRFGDWYLALAAYNSGAGRVGRVLKRNGQMDYWKMVKRRLLPRETRNYVPSILASMIIFKSPERYGFHVDRDPEIEFEMLPIKEQVDLEVAAELINVPTSLLMEYNPELRRGITPFDYPGYLMKVPIGMASPLRAGLAKLPPDKRIRVRHHRVESGQTLSLIASRYGSSIQAIAEVNRIRNIHRLRLGQDLIIPLRGALAARGRGVRKSSGSADEHIVHRGETLGKIARIYGVRLSDLLRWNNLRRRQVIHPGQAIKVKPQARVSRSALGQAGQ